MLLEVAGYNVLSAIPAKQALELDAEHPVHLVLLDLDAADLAARDFIARVRRRRDKLPVHVLSSKPWLPEGLKGKADGVIEKLRDPKLMVERVEEIPK